MLLLIGIAAVALARLVTYSEPPDRDLGMYLVIGHEMHGGKGLYRDLVDHKPPGVYATCYLAEFLTGYGRGEIYFLNVVAAAVSMASVYGACAVWTRDRLAACASVALFAVLSGNLKMLANQPNAETFMNAFTLAGLMALAIAYRKPTAWCEIMAAGICFGAASLYKQVFLPVPTLVMMSAVLIPHSGRTRARALGESALVGGIILGLWALVAAVFKLRGSYDDFVAWVFVYNREYAGDLVANLMAWLANPFPEYAHALLPPVLVALAGFAITGMRRSWQPGLTLLLLGVGTALAVALPGKGFPHYFQLWFPFASLGFGYTVAVVRVIPKWERLGAFCAAGVPLLLAAGEAPNLALSASAWSSEKYGPIFREASAVADFLNRATTPQEALFQFGDEPEIYFLVNRRPPVAQLGCYRLFSKTYGERQRADLLRELSACPPDAVVMDKTVVEYVLHPKVAWKAGSRDPDESPPLAREVIAFFTDNYRTHLPSVGRFHILARTGSPLERRWAEKPPRELLAECLKREEAKSAR